MKGQGTEEVMEEEKRKRKECLVSLFISPMYTSETSEGEREIAEERRSDHKIYIPWLPSYTHITYPLSICFHIFILRFHELKG